MKRALSHSRFIVILSTYSLDDGEVGRHHVEVYRSGFMNCPDALRFAMHATDRGGHPAPEKRNPTGRQSVADHYDIRDTKTGTSYAIVGLYEKYYGEKVKTDSSGAFLFPRLPKSKPRGKA